MEVLRFFIVGVFATITHISVASSFLYIFESANPFISNLIGFLTAFFVSFFGHAWFTFRNKGSGSKFLVTTIFGFAVNNACLYFALFLDFQGVIAIAMSAMISPLTVFVMSKYWVYV